MKALVGSNAYRFKVRDALPSALNAYSVCERCSKLRKDLFVEGAVADIKHVAESYLLALSCFAQCSTEEAVERMRSRDVIAKNVIRIPRIDMVDAWGYGRCIIFHSGCRTILRNAIP